MLPDPWRWERGSILKIKDRLYGEIPVSGPFMAMSATLGQIRWIARPVGYHNRLIL